MTPESCYRENVNANYSQNYIENREDQVIEVEGSDCPSDFNEDNEYYDNHDMPDGNLEALKFFEGCLTGGEQPPG